MQDVVTTYLPTCLLRTDMVLMLTYKLKRNSLRSGNAFQNIRYTDQSLRFFPGKGKGSLLIKSQLFKLKGIP
jgi:hypothetical protein